MSISPAVTPSDCISRRALRFVASLVAMGPSAWHTDPEALRGRIAALAEPVRVTAAFEVRVFDSRDES